MIAITITAIYLFFSLILYMLMSLRCRHTQIFTMPKSRAVYYFLSFTWGLPMTLIGCIVALIFVILGYKPVKYGWNYCFEFNGIDWGMELGIFFIAPAGENIRLKNHEHGHGIQNIYFGIFSIPIVTLPSLIRFRCRKWKVSLFGKKNKNAYDDIWFEGSATASGYEFMKRFNNSESSQ